ncbi:MAG: MotA/TolQ/ExbB proton channel family protein [Treponema sp.]|nr:MotA/TolQ/ExbB proton channel family protein [Treponema sp.]
MAKAITGFSLIELFVLGGVTMWPLLFFSIAALAITLERIVYLIYHSLKLDDLKEVVDDAIRNNKLPQAREFLEKISKRRIGAEILLTLVNRSDLTEPMLEKAVESQAQKSIASLENGLNLLTVLGSVSPLTGFLGTVTGMIGAFKAISEASEVNAQIVANGIYEALITTVYGLIIAIFAMSAHAIFTHIADQFTAGIESACSDLIVNISAARGKNET